MSKGLIRWANKNFSRHFLSRVTYVKANVLLEIYFGETFSRVFCAPLRLCCLMSRDDRKKRKWATIEQTECNKEIVVLTAMKRRRSWREQKRKLDTMVGQMKKSTSIHLIWAFFFFLSLQTSLGLCALDYPPSILGIYIYMYSTFGMLRCSMALWPGQEPQENY